MSSTHMETLTIPGQVFAFLFIVSSPMASACVPAAATGCEYMIPRPYGVVQRQGPGALYRYWAQERGPHFGRGSDRQLLRYFGRDQFVTFSCSVAEIVLCPAGYKFCFCSQPDAPCAHMCFTCLILRHTCPSFVPLASRHQPFGAKRACECCIST